jgi:hypothetical protein
VGEQLTDRDAEISNRLFTYVMVADSLSAWSSHIVTALLPIIGCVIGLWLMDSGEGVLHRATIALSGVASVLAVLVGGMNVTMIGLFARAVWRDDVTIVGGGKNGM